MSCSIGIRCYYYIVPKGILGGVTPLHPSRGAGGQAHTDHAVCAQWQIFWPQAVKRTHTAWRLAEAKERVSSAARLIRSENGVLSVVKGKSNNTQVLGLLRCGQL